MNVLELRDKLNELIEEGHGGLKVARKEYERGEIWHEEFDMVVIREEGIDFPGPLVEIY